MKIRNIWPTARDIAATGDVVEPGGTVEVDDDLGERLLDQPDVWVPADVYECPECPFEGKSEGGLTNHMKTHESEDA